MICLALRRQAFIEILGPLEKYMTEQKSEKRIAAHLSKLSLGPNRKEGQKSSKHRIPAQVLLQVLVDLAHHPFKCPWRLH
jgi:hypothetical protein